MGSLNLVQIIGHLGRDVELREASGKARAALSVATDDSYTDRDGNRVSRVEWHRVIVFDKMAENCARYLRKGSLVYVEGALQTRKWQDQAGQDHYSTEIRARRVQFLDRREQGSEGSHVSGSGYGNAAASGACQPSPEYQARDYSDAVPF